jgi:hypothetical protein
MPSCILHHKEASPNHSATEYLRHEFKNLLAWQVGRRSSVGRPTELRAGRSGDRNPVGGEIFRTRPARPWGPPNRLHNGYRAFPGGKTAEAWRWPHTPSSAEVKERVQLYLYSSFGPSLPVLGWPLPLLYFTWLDRRYRQDKTLHWRLKRRDSSIFPLLRNDNSHLA